MMAPVFLQCKSHPRRALTEHLLDVADRLKNSGSTWICLRALGLFHDLGKATSYFQTYLAPNEPNPPTQLKQHAELGALWLLQYLRRRLELDSTGPIDIALAYLFVKRHHGRLDDLLDGITPPDDSSRVSSQIEAMDIISVQGWLSHQNCSVDSSPGSYEDFLRDLAFQIKTGPCSRRERATISDFDAMTRFQHALYNYGLLIESDRDSAAGFSRTYFEESSSLTSEHISQFRHIGNYGPAEHNKQLGNARNLVYESAVAHAASKPIKGGQLWTLSVPTGAAKTLAALGWALKRREARLAARKNHSPIIYALPFTSIIDQNSEVIRHIWDELTDESQLAIHHHLAEPGAIALRGEESLARTWVEAWRSDIICTTFVQIVNALFYGTCSDARRLTKLAGSILILDEVQAFPAELWSVLRVALRSIANNFGTEILLTTATQPALFTPNERIEIAPPQIHTRFREAFDRYDVICKMETAFNMEQLRDAVLGQLTELIDCTVLVILNTIRESLELHKHLSEKIRSSDISLFHLSTNLRPKDRHRILKDIGKRNTPHVVVATQVVEAGVDLSFDVVFRALAPLDSVVQAAGRCNRHAAGQRGIVYLFDLAGATANLIYGNTHIGTARDVLSTASTGTKTRFSEPDFSELVDEYFERLNESVLGSTKSNAVFEAIRNYQFGALRGESMDRNVEQKTIRLIEDQFDRLPHFVETDKSDCEVWRKFCKALDISDRLIRRRKLRALRNEIGLRVIEVPCGYAMKKQIDDKTGFVHVPINISQEYYDLNIGWRQRT